MRTYDRQPPNFRISVKEKDNLSSYLIVSLIWPTTTHSPHYFVFLLYLSSPLSLFHFFFFPFSAASLYSSSSLSFLSCILGIFVRMPMSLKFYLSMPTFFLFFIHAHHISTYTPKLFIIPLPCLMLLPTICTFL